MKLIETPIKSNVDLETFYPNVTKYIFGKKAIKFYKLYTLDHTSVIYVDTFDKINIIMIGTKKKISKQEIEFVIKKILHASREEVIIRLNIKKEMEDKKLNFTEPRKDIILIQKDHDPE